MKISVVTVCRNAASTLQQNIESVEEQNYADKEHIIVDGQSTDGTIKLLHSLTRDVVQRWLSEPDHGIYDAMNKGIAMSSGDIIGILNADDIFFDKGTLTKVINVFNSNPEVDLVYGDVVFEKAGSIWRTYSARKWQPKQLAWGVMPPHPGVFVKKALYERLGLYKIDYQIAADYELLVRYFLSEKVKPLYLPLITTRMSLGGVSTRGFSSNLLLNREILRACRENNLYTNYLMIYSKYFYKWVELINV